MIILHTIHLNFCVCYIWKYVCYSQIATREWSTF